MYNEIKYGDIPILSFLKGTDYAMYVGPELNPKQRELLKSKDIPVPVIYLPEILEQLSESVVNYNFPDTSDSAYVLKYRYQSYHMILPSWRRKGVIAISFEESKL